MTILHGYARVRPEALPAALEACAVVREASVQEPGCDRYDYFTSPRETGLIVFVEEWSSRAMLQDHFERDAYKVFAGAMGPLLVTEPEIRIFDASLTG